MRGRVLVGLVLEQHGREARRRHVLRLAQGLHRNRHAALLLLFLIKRLVRRVVAHVPARTQAHAQSGKVARKRKQLTRSRAKVQQPWTACSSGTQRAHWISRKLVNEGEKLDYKKTGHGHRRTRPRHAWQILTWERADCLYDRRLAVSEREQSPTRTAAGLRRRQQRGPLSLQYSLTSVSDSRSRLVGRAEKRNGLDAFSSVNQSRTAHSPP